MRVVGFDTETRLIRPGLLAPKLICLSLAEYDGEVLKTRLLTRADALEYFEWLVDDPNVVLVGANTPYDLAVLCAENASLLPKVFAALDAGRVRCVQTRQKLIDIARGELKYRRIGNTLTKTTHDLATLSWYWCNRRLNKDESTGSYRLRFEQLENTPLADWPEEACDYAVGDAKATLDVYVAQTLWLEQNDHLFPNGKLPNEGPQYQAQWALHLMSTWGVRTDADAVFKLKAELEAKCAAAVEALLGFGLMRMTGPKKRPKASKDMKEIRRRVKAAFDARGASVPLTESGQIATDEETLRETNDESLLVLADSSHDFKLLTTYIPILERGTRVPINARYNVLVDSGRTSCRDPNFQNFSREGRDRECIVPRPGFLLASADYDTIELRALGQFCLDKFGYSGLVDAFKKGAEPHLMLAASLAGISVEEAAQRLKDGDPVIKHLRQWGKAGNYGFPGGLGVARFIDYAKSSGVDISFEQARELKTKWFEQWYEMKEFFAFINSSVGGPEGGTIVQHKSGRIRGGVSFTEASNSYFQGLVSDLAKEATYEASRECYLGVTRDGKPSQLYGSRLMVMCHDELIALVPKSNASNAAKRLAEVMIECGQRWLPDVPVLVSPVLMSRWYKDAKTKLGIDGSVVIWK